MKEQLDNLVLYAISNFIPLLIIVKGKDFFVGSPPQQPTTQTFKAPPENLKYGKKDWDSTEDKDDEGRYRAASEETNTPFVGQRLNDRHNLYKWESISSDS